MIMNRERSSVFEITFDDDPEARSFDGQGETVGTAGRPLRGADSDATRSTFSTQGKVTENGRDKESIRPKSERVR